MVLCGAPAPLTFDEMFELAIGGTVPGPSRNTFGLVVSQLSTGQPIDRAAAVVLQSSVDLHRSMLRCETHDDDCQARRNTLLDDKRAKAARGLAALSSTTDDPDVWAVAYRACHSPMPLRRDGLSAAVPKEPRCAAVTAGAWARLDPGNAAPWIEAAGVSASQGDASRVNALLEQAAKAAFVDPRDGGLARALAHPVFGLNATLALWVGEVHLTHPEGSSSWRNTHYLGAVSDWCARRAGTADGLAECRALVLLLLTRNRSSENTTLWAMAMSMGLLGNVRPLTAADEAQAFGRSMGFHQAWEEVTQRLPEGHGCDALRARRDHHVTAGRSGQATVVAEWLKANPGWRPAR